MAKPKAQTLAARFDPDPKHFLLTKFEFDRLCEVARIPEKEHFFFLVGLLVPSALNIPAALPKEGNAPSIVFILNALVVLVALILAVFQARVWYSKRKVFREFVSELEERPEGRLAFTGSAAGMYVGPIPSERAG